MIKRIVLEKFSGAISKERYTVYYNSGKSRIYNCFAADLPKTTGQWLFDFLEHHKGYQLEIASLFKDTVRKETILYDRGAPQCQKEHVKM